MADDEPKTKDWAVETVNSIGRVRVIEVYRRSNADAIAESANREFVRRGSATRAEVVRL